MELGAVIADFDAAGNVTWLAYACGTVPVGEHESEGAAQEALRLFRARRPLAKTLPPAEREASGGER